MAGERERQYFAELLQFHKIISQLEELTEDNFEDAIEMFQAKEGLLVDGDPGPETLWHLQFSYVQQNSQLPFVLCKAEVAPNGNGFDHLILRQDAAERYNLIKKELSDLGGILTTAGGQRSLSEGPGANQSAKSMHYAAIAFDLATASGFFDPAKDPFILTREKSSPHYWDVWSRAEGGKEMELEAIYWKKWSNGYNGKDLKKKVKGKFVNFTRLCKKHGFYPISPRRSFTRSKDRNYLGSEWWHFQANGLLVPHMSQFGIELLKIDAFTSENIESANSSIWGNRKCIFTKNWY